MAFDFLSTGKFTELNGVLALLDPPSWTRLEPQSTLGDPRPGIEARVHDPLWMIGRQWQLGEFQGEDAGTPLTVRTVTRTRRVDRWAPMGDAIVRPFGRGASDLLEPIVEREPPDGMAPGLRARAESGAVLLAALDDEGLEDARAAAVAAFPLDLGSVEGGSLDPAWSRLVRLFHGRPMVDGEALCQAVDAAGGALPPQLAPGAPGLLAAVKAWAEWHRAEIAPTPGGEDLWVGERFEYRFRIGAGPAVLDAPAHRGGAIDWYAFDASATALGEPDGPAALEGLPRTHSVLATPLRYPGMPADRLWEMEDAKVNLGVVEAEPWDLARLLVAEFALTYGNDWLVVPLDVPYGALIETEEVTYTTTFGERFVVKPTALAGADTRWRMFTLGTPPGVAPVDGLLVAPGAVAVEDGPALEEVLFLRDEMANLAWAVERIVEGPSGLGRERKREHDDPRPLAPGPVKTAQLDYLLQTSVPARWLPYLPRSSGYRSVELVQGRMSDPEGSPVPPIGRVLNRGDLKVLKSAEIPREGVLVRRQPSLTRTADGAYVHWTTRRVQIGGGEGSSRLAFDSAIPRQNRPNT